MTQNWIFCEKDRISLVNLSTKRRKNKPTTTRTITKTKISLNGRQKPESSTIKPGKGVFRAMFLKPGNLKYFQEIIFRIKNAPLSSNYILFSDNSIERINPRIPTKNCWMKVWPNLEILTTVSRINVSKKYYPDETLLPDMDFFSKHVLTRSLSCFDCFFSGLCLLSHWSIFAFVIEVICALWVVCYGIEHGPLWE